MNIEKVLEKIYELVATWGVRIVGVLIALIVGWMLAGWVRNSMSRAFSKRKFDPTLSQFFASLARYAILVGVVLGCLGVFGIQTTSFAAVIGAAGLAIGLAFQGTLGNFAAGVLLLVFRPFKVGDLINVGGEEGVVEEIQLFTTTLATLDNRYIIIPNTKIGGDTIQNMSHFEKRRVDIDVGADYSADIDETRAALLDGADKIEGILDDPPPEAFLNALGGSSVDWQLRVWCHPDDYWPVWQAATRHAKMSLDKAGIGIPFPQMDVHLDKSA